MDLRDAPDPIAVLAASHGRAMRTFAQGLGLDAAQAEDSVQESLLRVLQEVDRGIHVRDPKAWVYRTLYRQAMDLHRHRTREARAASRLPRPPDDLEATVDGIDDAAIWEVVQRLPERQRAVLHLRYVADLSFQAIGDALGISPSAARAHATLARQAVRARSLSRVAVDGESKGRLPTGPSMPSSGPVICATPVGVLRLGSLQLPPGGLREPGGIDQDPDGRIWIVDAGHDSIAIFEAEGQFRERWGRRGSERGQFSFQRALGAVGDVRFAADGSFYVADNGNYRIQHFDAQRRFIESFGTFGSGPGQFLDPWSVRLDADGLVYVSDAIREDVQVFSAHGSFIRTVGRGGSGPGELRFQGDAIPIGDRLFVADHWNRRVSIFDAAGIYERVIHHPLLVGPDGLDVLPTGDVLVADTTARRFHVLSQDGRLQRSWAGDAWMVRALPDGRILASGASDVAIYRVADAGMDAAA